MGEHTITVEVVHAAGAGMSMLRRVELPRGATVMQAIDASGIAAELPVAAIDPQRLGIFSRKVKPDQVLQAGDRIEIYRPLRIHPMDARRQRAR